MGSDAAVHPPRDEPPDTGPAPLVRPFWLVRRRTSLTREIFDVISMAYAVTTAAPVNTELEPEHLAVHQLCARPMSVADLATRLELPLAVVRVLLSDLREQGMIKTRRPRPEGPTDIRLLRQVADGLRRL
jgi:DNA-binding transcriptional ArsR family regulator